MQSPLFNQLIQSLCCLPGVGKKSAQRMALFLIERDKLSAKRLVKVLSESIEKIDRCIRCRNLTENLLCDLCGSERSKKGLLCVVETPADLLAIEQANCFFGTYFVLHGHLSPIDGIGPEELGFDELFKQLHEQDLKEVILATNLTLEGETTAQFIADKSRILGKKVSRIAYGVPMGGELEYVDGGTLSLALDRRKSI
ncbi:MAG: recombination protein RecR [Porticoccaceae bacterium]|nr:recombination protein RecR [Porticoccaceae bacterium]|tara:strand:- start:692 stop:1285 length:594 start_codon:yes stop_codon:yes gene_type:complete